LLLSIIANIYYHVSFLFCILLTNFDIPGDIVCAAQNSNVFSCTCRVLRQSGFASLLDQCGGRNTLFAPTNTAWNRLLGGCPTGGFFGNNNNILPPGLEFFPNSRTVDVDRGDDIVDDLTNETDTEAVVADESADGGRALQQQQNNNVLRTIMGYHIVNRVIPFTQLSCGDDRSIQMRRGGTSETRCQTNTPFAQQGTCNSEANLPKFINVIPASNGGIYSVNNVLIPSPDGTVAGCTGINGQCSTNPRCNTQSNCEDREECSGDWLPNNGNACCRRRNIINQCSNIQRCNTNQNRCENREECSGNWLPNGSTNNNNNGDACCSRFGIDPETRFDNCVCGNQNQCVNQIRFRYTGEVCPGNTQDNNSLQFNYCEDRDNLPNNPPENIPPGPPRPTYKVFSCGTDFQELDVQGEQQFPQGEGSAFNLNFRNRCLPECITIEIRTKNMGPNANTVTQRFNINTGINSNGDNCEGPNRNLLERNTVYGAFRTVNNGDYATCRNF